MSTPIAAPLLRAGGALVFFFSLAAAGCNRTFYRRQADREAYSVVAQKSNDPRWAVPGFNIEIDPRSRYFDPYDPDRPPLPPDDPASHRYMHCVDGKTGYRKWHADGDRLDLENPHWRDLVGDYAELTADGSVKLDLQSAVRLAYLHSPNWQQPLETIYLAALDVSAERFRFDTQFFGGTGTTFTHSGRDRSPLGERNTLQTDTDAVLRRRFATAGDLLVGFANSFVWQFAGPDTSATRSVVNFSLLQPLLRAGGRIVALEQLTIVERALLANLRVLERYRHGFFANVAVGEPLLQGPQRRGGFFGGTGLTGFTGQGSGGFGEVGGLTGFGRFGFGALGGGGGGGGAALGAAGGGAGTVGGFVGLLQQQQQIRNTQDSLNLQLRTLGLLEANYEAGLIDLTQVNAFRQSILTAQANLLQARDGLESQMDTFKRTTLGLPPDLPMELDDSMIEQFRFIDPGMTEIQDLFAGLIDRVGGLPAEPAVEDVSQALDELAELRQKTGEKFGAVRAGLETLESRSELRERQMTPEERSRFHADKERLVAALADLETRFQATAEKLDGLRAGLAADTAGQTADALVAQASELSGLAQELSLVQAQARLESVVLDPVALAPKDALRIARANRLDWMNNRAALVDTWRLIAFNANALRSNLSITFSGDMATEGDNPFRFQAPTGTLRAGVRFDPPFTRLLERNNYRSVLITYQQDRRQLIQFEDQVHQNLRQNLRILKQHELNLEIQRLAVGIAVRRVDQTREELNEPPLPVEPGQPPTALGPTAAQNLLSALDALSGAQNSFMSVWLNHYATRIVLMRDLGIMELDENGLWIDQPLDQALCAAEEVYPLPPEVPDEWLKDAGVEPDHPQQPEADSTDRKAGPAQPDYRILELPDPDEPGDTGQRDNVPPESDSDPLAEPAHMHPSGRPLRLPGPLDKILFDRPPVPRPAPTPAAPLRFSSRRQSR